MQRFFGSKKAPLRLAAVPRDHVEGDRRKGEAIKSGVLLFGDQRLGLADLDFAAIGTQTPIARHLQSFAWLRDLSEVASREHGAPLVEAVVGRWLVAHGTRPDEAWAPHLWGERLLFWTAYAPYLLSSQDSGYRAALLNTLARGARHVDAQADRADPGIDRITAWSGLTAAALCVEGAVPRIARAEAGLMRALAQGQFEDGGLMSRSPHEQLLLVDRLGLVRAAYFAAKQDLPDALDAAAAAALSALHGVTMGDGKLASWQGGHPGLLRDINAVVEGCGMRARPLRQARGWGYQRLSALGTIVSLDAAPPPLPAMAHAGSASTLAIEIADGDQRIVVSCGGPGLGTTRMPRELIEALRSTAAHSTLTVDDSNSTAIMPDGKLGRGVTDVAIDRIEDNDASRIVASHDGYARRYGLIHERRLALGNDGKLITGEDKLEARGRKKIKDAVPFALRFHLAPGIEITPTADGLGAILRSENAPAWNFRCRGAMLTIEESLHVDGRGTPQPSQQLVIVGETSRHGTDIAWQFRRSS
ncbi:heparinase II/III family protein [Sphingomicrobium clamense]|uniref:Heparinase II/III family protein n=1 Tax=Sphingomicrobium clamense TaxID=2851013 RepID=A0ABS6V365_9SPHN|nr:heparinase II/III family protein [Sphingomicrobium sp. B8]MBW0143999.1 heparinase II/III family protein [Sphingomicrobium sp. B8]